MKRGGVIIVDGEAGRVRAGTGSFKCSPMLLFPADTFASLAPTENAPQNAAIVATNVM